MEQAMKNPIIKILLPLLMFFSAITSHALTCESLFVAPFDPYTITSDSARVRITKVAGDHVNSRLTVEEGAFSRDVNVASIELVRMLIRNSDFKLEDKNVLLKNKFTLGIPVKDGYVLQLTYESSSNAAPRFILQDKVVLITPAGREIRITNDLMSPDQLRLNRTDFEMADYAVRGLELNLKVPLVVEGPLLSKFSHLADYFKYFRKEELSRVFQSNSMLRIESQLKLRKAKHVFHQVLIKEPFKFLIGGAIALTVMNSQMFIHPAKEAPAPVATAPAAISMTHMNNTLNNIPIPANQPTVRAEFQQLRAEITQKVAVQSFAEINAYDVRIDPNNMFSREHNLFVFTRVNENTNSTHTYVVFAQDVSQSRNLGLQYYVFEVSAARYTNLIRFIGTQGGTMSEASGPAAAPR